MPDTIVKNICKYDSEECGVCKTLKDLKDKVDDVSMQKFEDVVEAVE